jgi:hypothetical protein
MVYTVNFVLCVFLHNNNTIGKTMMKGKSNTLNRMVREDLLEEMTYDKDLKSKRVI